MAYKIIPTSLSDVLILEPQVFGDERGFFFESFNAEDFEVATGVKATFVQDNHSRSQEGVLRGLHYQVEQPQGKLIRVVIGEIFDVAVDVRRNSPDFGKWVGVNLSAENRRQLWVPEGFAHGFYALAQSSDVLYKTTAYYAPEHERTLLWNDPHLGISWPIVGSPSLSAKDRVGRAFEDSELF